MDNRIASFCLKAMSEAYNGCCEDCPIYGEMGTDHCSDDALVFAVQAIEKLEQYRELGTVEELQKSVKEEDVLKFYYIESEDKYVVGKRLDNFYYAEVGKTGLAFYMSRYLPWGEHVVAPGTLWKEHTYPSEPKEIPFFDWLQGFIEKECGGTIEELKALKEKAEPKEPIIIEEKINENNERIMIEWKCPVCGLNVIEEPPCQNYCQQCGNRLNWQGKE